ncbi:solute carrier family 35 member E1-like [Dysidea avara]|uniref:solute carrier family 35 member E1-like n=1 Tax=Dysidea avara TaxID=196820 RepID=UPI00331F0768
MGVYRDTIKIVLLCAIWFSFSSGTNVIGKQILTVFPYPTTLTMIQLMIINCFLGPTLALLGVEEAPYVTRRQFVRRIAPLGIGKIMGSVSAYISILKMPVSYSHTVKALMPLFVVLLSYVIMREKYPWKVYLSLVPIVGGVLLATVTELQFNALGLIAALFATMCFALQNIYSKKALKELHLHHLRLLLVICQVAGIVVFPIWMFTDAWELVSAPHNYFQHMWLFLMLPLNGLFNFGQNIAAFTVLSNVSPVSYSVATVTKRVVIIVTSLQVLHNPVTSYNVLGMAMAILGIAFYNKAKYDSNLKSKVLPTHIDDFTDNGSHDSRKQHIMINSSDVTNSNHRRIPMKII